MDTSAEQKIENQIKRKRRRNSYAKKGTSTMHFQLDSNKRILPALQDAKDSQENIVYCDKVLKVHTRFQLVPFQIVITKTQIFLFKESSGNLKRKISMHTIDSICLSHQSDNFLLLRLKNGGDLLLVSPHKIQIVRIIAQNWDKAVIAFPLSITDRFRYRIDEKLYAIIFTRSDFGVEISVYEDKNEPQQENKRTKKSK